MSPGEAYLLGMLFVCLVGILTGYLRPNFGQWKPPGPLEQQALDAAKLIGLDDDDPTAPLHTHAQVLDQLRMSHVSPDVLAALEPPTHTVDAPDAWLDLR